MIANRMASVTLTVIALVGVMAIHAAVVPSALAGTKVALSGATLAEVREKLLGGSGQPGVLDSGDSFEASFERMSIGAEEMPELRALIREMARLPAGSEMKLEGKLDGRSFEVKLQKGSDGRMRARVEGLTFENDPQLLELLAPMLGDSLKELKVDARIADRVIKIRVEQELSRAPVTSATPRTEDPPRTIEPVSVPPIRPSQ